MFEAELVLLRCYKLMLCSRVTLVQRCEDPGSFREPLQIVTMTKLALLHAVSRSVGYVPHALNTRAPSVVSSRSLAAAEGVLMGVPRQSLQMASALPGAETRGFRSSTSLLVRRAGFSRIAAFNPQVRRWSIKGSRGLVMKSGETPFTASVLLAVPSNDTEKTEREKNISMGNAAWDIQAVICAWLLQGKNCLHRCQRLQEWNSKGR